MQRSALQKSLQTKSDETPSDKKPIDERSKRVLRSGKFYTGMLACGHTALVSGNTALNVLSGMNHGVFCSSCNKVQTVEDIA